MGSGQDADAASRRDQVILTVNFHQDLAIQNVEELLRLGVVVADLGCTRRHKFLDNAQVLVAYQIPAIAVDSPAVMLGIVAADGGMSNWAARARLRILCNFGHAGYLFVIVSGAKNLCRLQRCHKGAQILRCAHDDNDDTVRMR